MIKLINYSNLRVLLLNKEVSESASLFQGLFNQKYTQKSSARRLR